MRIAVIPVFLVALAASAVAVPHPEATARGPVAPADTLRYTLTAGQTLVVPLPGPDGATFRPLRMPALSHLADRSFGWRTLPGEQGREYVLIERRAARTDTLVLVVDVE